MKRKVVLTLVILFFVLIVISNSIYAGEIQEVEPEDNFYPRAEIIETQEIINEDAGYYESTIQRLKVIIKNGEYAGEEVEAQYELNYYLNQHYESQKLKVGDEVLLYLDLDESDNIVNAYVSEIVRDKYLLYLLIGFILCLLIIGKAKGVKAIISLAITILAIVKILIPNILKGWDPVLLSVGVCILIITVSLIIISGFSKKTLAAIMGTIGGVVVAGLIALGIGTLSKLTGLGNEESQMLMYIPQEIALDFRGLLFAGIIIGAMGATMDVGMSISSAMHEIKKNSPLIKTKELIQAGMNVGRDMMATMANTLILAYTGGSIQLILVFMAYNTSFATVINWDMIASEILRAISGSIGIIFTIPITAIVAGLIEEKFS